MYNDTTPQSSKKALFPYGRLLFVIAGWLPAVTIGADIWGFTIMPSAYYIPIACGIILALGGSFVAYMCWEPGSGHIGAVIGFAAFAAAILLLALYDQEHVALSLSGALSLVFIYLHINGLFGDSLKLSQ